MAAIVGWETLRGLARFRAEKGLALSFYVGLDPSVTPTAAEADTRFNSLLHDAERKAAAARGELTHEQREALKGDLERVRRYFDDEFDRDGAHGLAVFSAGLDNFWTALPLAGTTGDDVKVARDFYVAPLIPLITGGEGAIVAFVSRERGDLYRMRGGRLHEVADLSEEMPGRHDQGGWSQARYQRHIEAQVADHLRRVADELNRRWGALRGHLSSSSRPRRRGPSSTTCWHRRRARRSPDGRLRRRTRPRRTWSRRRCRSSRTGSLVASRS